MMQNKRKRKMMLVLPLLIIPFLTLGFYAMGGGKGEGVEQVTGSVGLNDRLPEANLKEEKLLDKLGFYNKADKDSAKMAEWMRTDPYYKPELFTDDAPEQLEELTLKVADKNNQRLRLSPYEQGKEKPEDELLQKLQLLQSELNKNSTPDYKPQEPPVFYRDKPVLSNDVNRLEGLMEQMNTASNEDPEMTQLSSVMDKILDIQHPERVLQRRKETMPEEIVNRVPVSGNSLQDTTVNSFYGLTNDTTTLSNNAIAARVADNQILVNGAVIKLQLQQDIYLREEKIPAGSFLYGTVTLNAERLQVTILTIRYGTSIYPVSLEVYDMDGLAGIYIPGAITRDVMKQSGDNSLQQLGMASIDPSLKAQAAAAGINTAKNLLSRKSKLVKVMVKAGYKVLLYNKVH